MNVSLGLIFFVFVFRLALFLGHTCYREVRVLESWLGTLVQGLPVLRRYWFFLLPVIRRLSVSVVFGESLPVIKRLWLAKRGL